MSEYGAPPPPSYGAMPPGQPPAGSPPPNYLVWAILETVCCCVPLGIVGIVFASQVNSKWAAGDFAGAQESSAKAKKFLIWGLIVGIIVDILLVVGYVALIAAASNSTSP